MNRAANILSYLLHPVFMPTLSMLIVLNYATAVNLRQGKVFVILVCVVFTFLLPVMTILSLKLFKMVSSIHLPTKEERRLPILASVAYFFMAYRLIQRYHLHPLLDDIMAAGLATMIFISLVNFVYKLSIHMAAIGSLTGLLTALCLFPNSQVEHFLLAAVIIAGIAGFARLQLKAHSAGEVFIGYFAGFIPQYLLMILFIVKLRMG